MKIVVLDYSILNPGDIEDAALFELGEVTTYPLAPKHVAEALAEAEMLLVNSTPVDEALLAQAPKLKYVGVFATGYDKVDVAAAAARSITVTNVSGYSTMAVAQHTMALLLELTNHAGAHAAYLRQNGWMTRRSDRYGSYSLTELAGKTMGIVGYGRIGRAAANMAQCLGMQVVVNNRSAIAQLPKDIRQVELQELYEVSDVVSLHCPLSDSTRGMIDREAIAAMKDGVLLLNTARGPLLVEEDLAAALHSGKVGGAGLDVLASEPPEADNPLLDAPRTVITSHMAWGAQQTRQRLVDQTIENVRAYMDGHPQNVVQP